MLTEGDVAQLSPLLRRRALVSGRAVFRASGSLLRIEAERVGEATEKDNFFARLPTPNGRKFDLRRILHEQRHKRGVAAILGTWGPILQFPEWLVDLSPFAHSPVPSGGETDWSGGIWMLAIGLAAGAVAVAAMRRRELASGG